MKLFDPVPDGRVVLVVIVYLQVQAGQGSAEVVLLKLLNVVCDLKDGRGEDGLDCQFLGLDGQSALVLADLQSRPAVVSSGLLLYSRRGLSTAGIARYAHLLQQIKPTLTLSYFAAHHKTNHSPACLFEDATPRACRSIAHPVVPFIVPLKRRIAEYGIQVFFPHLHKEDRGVALKICKDGGLHAIGRGLQLGYSMLSGRGLNHSSSFSLHSHPICRQFLARQFTLFISIDLHNARELPAAELALGFVPLVVDGLGLGLLGRALALIEGLGVDVRVSDIDGHVDGVCALIGIRHSFVAAFLLIVEVLVLWKSAIRKTAHMVIMLYSNSSMVRKTVSI